MRIPRRKPIELSNPQAVKELGHFKDVIVEILEDEERIDYSHYPINQLRRIATQVGIKGSFSMKKTELIKKLEEKNVTTI